LGPLTRFYLLLFSFDSFFILFLTVVSLTRKRVCSLQCLHSLVRPLTTNNYILPSHLRLCSLSVASYDSQGLRWKYSNPPPHGEVQNIVSYAPQKGLNINQHGKRWPMKIGTIHPVILPSPPLRDVTVQFPSRVSLLDTGREGCLLQLRSTLSRLSFSS
jgi:hypothetical protein